MNADISLAVLRWNMAAKQLAEAKREEAEARLALCAIAFRSPTEGVNNQPLGDGTILQGTFRSNYNLDQPRVEQQLKLLPKATAANLVKWDASLRVGAYKGLEPAHKAIVNEVLTIKPGMPALEIVKPKGLE
jgi:hypothetical protein